MGLISRVSSRTYRNSQVKQTNPLFIMIIPTDDRLKIWRTLFAEGVMVAQKDSRTVHKETNLRNLYVMKALQSLKSKGFVKENYTWQHYHWALTDEGITYLRTAQPPRERYAKHPQANPGATGPTRPTTKQ